MRASVFYQDFSQFPLVIDREGLADDTNDQTGALDLGEGEKVRVGTRGMTGATSLRMTGTAQSGLLQGTLPGREV